MSKRLLYIVVVVLTLSSVTWASSFAGGQVNGSLRMGCYSTGPSIQSGATGYPRRAPPAVSPQAPRAPRGPAPFSRARERWVRSTANAVPRDSA